MCTAISINKYNHYLCRSLDLEFNYNEEIIFIPRNYPLKYRYNKSNNDHYAFYGVGIINNNYPLLYDGCNEKGLSIAGLNLPNSTVYSDYKYNKINICSFELIPFILSNCANCDEAKQLLLKINVTNDNYSNSFPVSKLHFIICDSNNSIVLEIINKNIIIHDNPNGVLTNEPSFNYHLENINNYSFLNNEIKNNIKGTQLLGIPGDNLSQSRFIKAIYNKKYIVFDENNITEIFNIFNNIFEINGLAKIDDNKYYKTIYMVIYNTTDNILYIRTYKNSQIISFNLKEHDINRNQFLSFNVFQKENIIHL